MTFLAENDGAFEYAPFRKLGGKKQKPLLVPNEEFAFGINTFRFPPPPRKKEIKNSQGNDSEQHKNE